MKFLIVFPILYNMQFVLKLEISQWPWKIPARWTGTSSYSGGQQADILQNQGQIKMVSHNFFKWVMPGCSMFGQIDERSTNSELLGSIKYMFTVHRSPSKRRRAARDVASVAWLQKGILDGYEVLQIWLVPTQGLSWGLMSMQNAGLTKVKYPGTCAGNARRM